MALTSTMFNLVIDLSDVDRGVYETLDLKVAQHPSETSEYMLTRILAYALEYTDGIAFSAGGISSTDEPPVVVRDLTGRITAWIEVGFPDADRLHRAAKLAERVAVYTHRDIRQLLAQLEGKKIHRREEIPIYWFDRNFISSACASLERRTEMTLSITERHLYMTIGKQQFETTINQS